MPRGGRTHAVRNAYGHIEYLTDDEIANLRERGEDIDVVGTYRGYPQIAKNPANQAYINEAWQQQGRRGSAFGDAVKGVITAAGIASTVHGGIASPQQQSPTTNNTYGQSSLRVQGERRGAQASDATGDKGNRDRNASRR